MRQKRQEQIRKAMLHLERKKR